MKKIKILQFSIGNIKGGITRYVLNNWNFINREKYQFDFVTMGKKLDFEYKLKKQGSKVFYMPCYAEDNPERFSTELNHILDENYDVIHIHTSFWRGMLVEQIAKSRGINKIIIHSHNSEIYIDYRDEEKKSKAIELHNELKNRISTDLATDFWACSKLAADWLFGNQVPDSSIKIMKNAIDIEKFLYNEKIRKAYQTKLGLDKCLVLGNVGRFTHQKNHEMLIEILHIVSKKIKNIKLLLIGCGELEKEIREKVQNYELEDKVDFLGLREDVNSLMQCMDIFVFPSRFEGLPISLVEAQAAGLKVICSDTITKETKITDNIEFLPLNVDEWVNKILEYKEGYVRENQKENITRAGYNIVDQIKIIEREYQG